MLFKSSDIVPNTSDPLIQGLQTKFIESVHRTSRAGAIEISRQEAAPSSLARLPKASRAIRLLTTSAFLSESFVAREYLYNSYLTSPFCTTHRCRRWLSLARRGRGSSMQTYAACDPSPRCRPNRRPHSPPLHGDSLSRMGRRASRSSPLGTSVVLERTLEDCSGCKVQW